MGKLKWEKADEPPDGVICCWTEEVVVISNFGNVFLLAYYHGKNSGVWQRPARFIGTSEKVEWWAYKPKSATCKNGS